VGRTDVLEAKRERRHQTGETSLFVLKRKVAEYMLAVPHSEEILQ